VAHNTSIYLIYACGKYIIFCVSHGQLLLVTAYLTQQRYS